jgi:DNA-binding NtrC family response regulator
MFESDLLGVERGAFTGATESKPGILSRAQNGILVLDELQHLTKEAQARLLVPLQNKSFRRKGSTVEQKIDFQVIALTTVNVDGKEGKEVFLPDLIGRLKGTTVYFESASDNPELVPIIVRSCFEMAEVKISDSQLEEMISLLSSQVWEKNFREVELMICSIVQQAKFASISPLSALKRILRRSTVPPSLRDDDIDRRTSGESEFQRMVREGKSLHQLFEDVEKASLIDAYRSGLKQEQICRYFNFTRSTLFRKLERYKIARELHRNTGDLPDG